MNKVSTPKKPYLWFRPDSKSIWFRMAVPVAFRHVSGKNTIACSLKTTDVKEAMLCAGEKRAKLIREWEQSVRPHSVDALVDRTIAVVPNLSELQAAVTKLAYDKLTQRVRASPEQQSAKNASIEVYKASLSAREDKLLSNVQDSDGTRLKGLKRAADFLIKKYNWDIPTDSECFDQLTAMLGEASLDAQRVMLDTDKGNLGAAPRSPTVISAKAASARRASPGQSILELFEIYASQRLSEGAKRPDGVKQDRPVVALFADFVGKDRSVDAISVPDAREFVDTAKKLPISFAKRKAYRGLSIKQVIAKGQKEGGRTISPVTHARYVSTISPFFDWLRASGYSDTQPFSGLHPHPRKGKNPRPPLSTAQLNTILNSPLFVGFLRDGREYQSGQVQADDWRRWIPLICLFTGARIGEVAQLLIHDVTQIHDIWFIHLRDDEKTNQHTKSGKSRSVPVHSTLISIGLLSFLEKQKHGANGNTTAALFPQLGTDKRDQIGAIPSRFWRNYLSEIGIKNGADGFGAHSFRHTIADEFRRAGYMDDAFGPMILGHSNKSVTGSYGILAEGTAQMRYDMIESVVFQGVDFGHLVKQR
jgi:integrase